MRANVNASGFKYFLNPSYLAIFQHHFDAARVVCAGREDTRNDAYSQRAAPLVVFFDDQHSYAGFDVAPPGDAHIRIRSEDTENLLTHSRIT